MCNFHIFRKHFCDKEHLNYRCHDAVLGPILISVMQESATTELIVRTSNGTVTESLTVESPDPATLSPDSVLNLVKILAPDITTETISHIDDEQIQVRPKYYLQLKLEDSVWKHFRSCY